MINTNLLVKIRQSGLRQRDFAKLVGDHETMVSRVVNGYWNLDEARKEKYAKVLKCKVSDIFKNE